MDSSSIDASYTKQNQMTKITKASVFQTTLFQSREKSNYNELSLKQGPLARQATALTNQPKTQATFTKSHSQKEENSNRVNEINKSLATSRNEIRTSYNPINNER